MDYEAAKATLLEHLATTTRKQTTAVLELGKLATRAITARLQQIPPANRHAERARTLADLREAIKNTSTTDPAELARWVRCYGTATAFDLAAAKQLPLNTIRAFAPLVTRNRRNETWTIKAKHHAFAMNLWATATTQTAATIASTIEAHLHPGRTHQIKEKRLPGRETSLPPQPVTVEEAIKQLPNWTTLEKQRLMNALRDSLTAPITTAEHKGPLAFLRSKAG